MLLDRLLHELRRLFADLPHRALLTIRYRGWGEFLVRVVTFPLRLTPLRRFMPYGHSQRDAVRRARAWYRKRGRPVTVVIAAYGPPAVTVATAESVKKTTDRRRVRIVVVDDGSPAEHQEGLRRSLEGVELILASENRGFAANANRGLRAAEGDVVLMNNDMLAQPGWLEALQFRAYSAADIGILGPKLLYPDGRIQSAGSHRNLDALEWFDHRYRFRPGSYQPSYLTAPVMATTGACMYIKRSLIDAIGIMDERFPMAYEDADYCLRAWEAGFRVVYCADATLTHVESTTRGMTQGERELTSQRRFWEKWSGWFDRREVRSPDGALRIVYVTEDTGIGGGHRDVFEHLNRLKARGHEVELYSLAGPPEWFELDAPVRRFDTYDELQADLAEREAIKVATWWRTAAPVWMASVRRGIPVYFVQDIETSYYAGKPEWQRGVLESYRHEFRYLTISNWNRERLLELGVRAVVIAPGVNHETFRPLGLEHRDGVLLTLGRTNPLKNLPLTLEAWRGLDGPRPELWMFGIEPELGERTGARYVYAPSDEEVNRLINEASVFVQTSRHEGFCLPLLEAMAAGTAVICTDAHGNRDFCRHEENCLLVESEPAAVRAAMSRLLGDPELRRRLEEGGRKTAAAYRWEPLIDELEAFYERISQAQELVLERS